MDSEATAPHSPLLNFPAHIMTDSFYGGRGLFGDLGPETDVDLLDEDAHPEGQPPEGRLPEGQPPGGKLPEGHTEFPQVEGGPASMDSEEAGQEVGGCRVETSGSEERVVCSEEAVVDIQEAARVELEIGGGSGAEEEAREEELEIGGGSGAEEEAYDDSEEEEAEWKYVSVKSGGVGAVSPEVDLGDEPACVPTPSELDINTSASAILEQTCGTLAQVVTEGEALVQEESLEDKVKEEEADEYKLLQGRDVEVLQKAHIEENLALKSDPLEKALENQTLGEEVLLFLGGGLKQEPRKELEESLEDSAMESRLNPDAAEFVPISPTRNVVPESFSIAGREFDLFRKEAAACPGEISDDGVSQVNGKSLIGEEESNVSGELLKSPSSDEAIDGDVVLSSSFNCVQQTVEVEKLTQDPYDFVDDDENKENVQECENKENIVQHINSEFVLMSDEVLGSHSEDIEKLEEPLFRNDVPSLVDSPHVLAEDSSASKMVSESVEVDKFTQGGELHSQKDGSLEIFQQSIEVQSKTKDSFSLHSDAHLYKALSAEVIPGQPGEHVDSFLVDYLSDNKVRSSGPEEIVHESAIERHSSMQDESCEYKTHENISLRDFDEQNLSFTRDQIPDKQIQEEVCGSLHKERLLNKMEKVIEGQTFVVNDGFELKADEQVDHLSVPEVDVEYHTDEQLPEEQIQISPTEMAPTRQLDEQVQPSQLVESVHNPLLQDCASNLAREDNQQNYHNIGEQYPMEMVKDLHVRLTDQENPTKCITEPYIDIYPLGMDLASIVPEPVIPAELEVKTIREHVLSPNPAADAHSLPETSLLLNLDTKSPMHGLKISSDIQTVSEVITSEVKLSVPDSVSKPEPNELLAAINGPIFAESEIKVEQVEENLELVSSSGIPHSENIAPLEEISVVKSVAQVKELNDARSEEPIANTNSSDHLPEKTISKCTDGATIASVAETLGASPSVSAVLMPTMPVEVKSSKKATSTDKKKVLEKAKAPSISAATAKGKPATKSPIPPSRTSLASAKPSVTSPTKVGGTLNTKPSTAERKTATQVAGKTQPPSKSVSAPLSSKPRTSTLKPSTVPTTRPAPPSRVSTTAARPGTAGTLTRQGMVSAPPKTASAAPKSSVAHPKVTEVKRTVNGEALKASSVSNTASTRIAPRKVPSTSSTTASKPSASPTKTLPSARPTPISHKTATEALPAKSKASNVVNGNAPKPARAFAAAGSKSAAPQSAQTRKPAPMKTMSSTTSGDPKKAKESANKHISANRAGVGFSGARRSIDMKGSVATKANAIGRGQPAEAKKTVSNGTVVKKTVENLDSIKDEEKEKMGLVMSGHSNGIAVEANEVTKVEGSVVQGLCEGKEQVMIIVEEGVGVGDGM